jgi:tRNA (guanine37-N1)-methyltransferase
MLDSILGESILKRAQEAGLVRIRCVNLRDFATGAHLTTDDRPYGGGPGMVMKPEPVFKAVDALRRPESKVILMTPQGAPFKQATAMALSKEAHLIFLCGHYEGVDERIREALADLEISIGDYVLTNGVISAAIVVDAVVRLLPGALGGEGAADDESFTTGLLEYPQYTRPPVFRGMAIPEISPAATTRKSPNGAAPRPLRARKPAGPICRCRPRRRKRRKNGISRLAPSACPPLTRGADTIYLSHDILHIPSRRPRRSFRAGARGPGGAVLITRHDETVAYVVSKRRMDAIVETLELLANPVARKALARPQGPDALRCAR